MNDIVHVFFDLDRTLWDFEQNSHDELTAIFNRNGLMNRGISLVGEFIKIYKKINEECWTLYRENKITKEALRSYRFEKTLNYFGIEDPKLADRIGEEYVTNSPYRTKLIDHTTELLDYLAPKYQLHMITNGFEEVQHIKLKECKLDKYFGEIITSEMAGVKKPAQQIFDLAISKTNATPQKSVYIGDDLVVDVLGAKDAGWKSIYYNPHGVQHNHEILADVSCLSQITEVL